MQCSENSTPGRQSEWKSCDWSCEYAATELELLLRSISGLFATQIFVVLINPVSAWRIENVQIHGVHERFCLVRHVRRNSQHFPGMDRDLAAVDPELQRTFQNVGDLLIDVAMVGHDAALLQQDARQHNVMADHELTLEQRVQAL